MITTDLGGAVDLPGDLSEVVFTSMLPDVDTVIHCAAVQYVTPNLPLFKRSKFFKKNNLSATANLCERYQSVNHFIHVGTSMMYQPLKNLPFYTENCPLEGVGVYSKSKKEAQFQVNKIKNAATVVPCIIGGKGREGLFSPFVRMIQKSPLVFLPGRCNNLVQMVHVEDVADLILLLSEKKAMGIFNAGGPDPLSIREWVREICDVLHLKEPQLISLPIQFISSFAALTRYRFLAKEQVLMLKKTHVLSTEKSERLGWKPQYNNAEIARLTATYLKRDLS